MRPLAPPSRWPRWLAAALCAVPLLAQAQSHCNTPNTDDDYILGEAQSQASAMHWSTGLVWNRCLEGMAFNSGTGQCTGTAAPDEWQNWATNYLPKYFSESASSYPHLAPSDRDFLASGAWRMAYRSELISITENCGVNPKVNRVVFPDTPPSVVWSGSPLAGDPNGAWLVYFSYGNANVDHRSLGFHVRLVRGGQSFAALTSPAAQAGAAGDYVTFPDFTLAASTEPGQAWGGARVTGAGSAEFQMNGAGEWVRQAIVKSGDRITVRLRAPSTAGDSATATFTLRSGQTTGTDASGFNGGDETTVMVEKTATFTANGVVNGACASVAASATAPSTSLCATGTATSVSGSGGQWAWGCNGSHGGSSTSAAACTAPYASQTLSISASPATITVGGTSAITASSSAAGLAVTLAPSGPCTLSGTTATGTAQGTCTITASQAGTGDTGASRYLAATSVSADITVNLAPITGQCGSASGGTLTSAPSTNLCSAGNASSVSGSGPWSWTCQGINGGGNSATCTASLQTWAVTASASPAQGGTATCSPASVAHGSGATCTATASTGYQFSAWTGACAGQAATCTLANVTAAQDSVAQFTRALVVPEGPQAQKPLGLALQPGTGWQVTQASTQTAASVGAALPAGVTLPHGVVNLRLELGTAGSTAQVVLTYPEALPAGAVYYKYGPVVKNGPSRWYPFQGAQISGNTVTLTLEDGVVGDDDLTENSVINDPGGVAVLSTPAPAGAQAIPTLGEWALALLAGALGLFSLGALRRRGA